MVCTRVFEINDPLRVLLLAVPNGYERRDYCLQCVPDDVAIAALASWQTRRPPPSRTKPRPFDAETVLTFFRRLGVAETPEQRQFRFVLALLLWRRKVLRFERSVAGQSAELWEFTARDGERFQLERPRLEESEVEALSAQLEALLAGAAEPGVELGVQA